MRTLFYISLTGLLIGVGILVYRTPYSQCNTPLTYKIGSIDPKFGLKLKDVLTDTQDAAKILNDAGNYELFAYATPSGELTINFIYDERTALNNSVNFLEGQINQENTTLQQQIISYEAAVKIFEQKLSDLNATIQKYNNAGGAPADVYANLISQQNQLKSEGDVLNTRAKQLNLATNDYNHQVQNLNQNVRQFNQAIVLKPEEGLYESETKTITIYFANNKQELIHTLAHELGHALGMVHVNNMKAIMYPSASAYLTPTQQDTQQLEALCREIPLPQHWINLLKTIRFGTI